MLATPSRPSPDVADGGRAHMADSQSTRPSFAEVLTAKQQARFWSYVDKSGPNGCWVWMRSRHGFGYGFFGVNRRTRRAHRIAWELLRGPIPDGLTLDHLCRNPPCVNPDHLEVVTMRENTLRGESVTAINARKTHCKRGHLLGGNSYLVGRRCVECHRISARERKRRISAARKKA